MKLRLLIIGILVILAVGIFIPQLTLHAKSPYLQVHFFDIGQGDSIFIETPDGVQVLVDGGPDDTVLRRLAEFMPYADRSINMIVRTHPDSDHITGLVDVLNDYDVANILTTENVSDTQTSQAFEAAARAEHAHIIDARRGQVFKLGASTTLRVLFPDQNPAGWDTNRSSIVLQLQYGATKVLLTGDSPSTVEQYLVGLDGSSLQSDVLKPGHHGSRSATSQIYLDAVQPTYAVISAGKNNRYGHPTKEVMDRLHANGIIVYSTIDDGTVSFESDGKTIVPEETYPLATTIGGP